MERHSLLILSNLDTVEHLEIGIWLISDTETEGTLLRRKKKGDGTKLDFVVSYIAVGVCVCLGKGILKYRKSKRYQVVFED